MNKQRLIKLIDILKTKTDMDHKLSVSDICVLLEEGGIPSANRKTLYDDFRTLEAFGYDIEYDNGYYLSEAPFTLSEVKIMIDSLNSLKNLDDAFLKRLKDKLYSFISIYETKQLKKLEYRNRHRDLHFINRLEDTLNAIKNEKMLIIQRRTKKESEEIAPLFLYRENDYYYLYYHYEGSDRIYHTRFDNITSMNLTEKTIDITIPVEKIIANIEESSSSFHSSETSTIRFTIINDSERLRQRLQDDFPKLSFTGEGFFVKTSISEPLFAKLSAYGDDIKIDDPEVADRYVTFLQKIITRNSSENRNNQ